MIFIMLYLAQTPRVGNSTSILIALSAECVLIPIFGTKGLIL